MRLVLKIVGVLIVLAVVALGFALFTDFEAPRLGQRLMQIAAEAAGIELEAERVVLNLRRGLLLEGVEARAEADGETFSASLDLLQVECALIPLIRGEIVVERILLQSPTVEIVSRDPAGMASAEPAPPPEAAPRETDSDVADSSLAQRPKPVQIGELSILNARFVSRSERPGGSTTEIEALEFRLFDFKLDDEAPSAIVGVSGRGRLSAAVVRLDDRQLNNLQAELVVDGGRYLLTDVEATGRSGAIEIERLEVDFKQDPYRYRVVASVRDANLDAILEGIDGSGLGRASLELNGTGEGPGLDGAVADVVLELQGGELPSVEILGRIDRLLGTSLDRAEYLDTEIHLSLVGRRLEVEPFEIVAGIVRLGIGGTVELDGKISLEVSVGLPREAFAREDVSVEVLDRFTDSAGWLTVPLAVSGTRDDPRFGADREAIEAATRRLAEDAKEAAQTRILSELEGAIRRRLRPSS